MGKPIWGIRLDSTKVAHLAVARAHNRTADKALVFESYCGTYFDVPEAEFNSGAYWREGRPVPLGVDKCGSCVKAVDRLSDDAHEPVPTTVTETVIVRVTRPVKHKSLVDSIEGIMGQAGRRQWDWTVTPVEDVILSDGMGLGGRILPAGDEATLTNVRSTITDN